MLDDLPHQSELDAELSDGDLRCLSEIRGILAKHGREKRFGVLLMHRHFPMSADEIPMEAVDEQARASVVNIVRVNEVEEGSIATAWRLDGVRPVPICLCPGSCQPD